MEEVITLPPGFALGIIAFLLSLLPAGLFIWLWYLRRTDRPVRAPAVAMAFGGGLALVVLAFQLEQYAAQLWQALSPATSHYFNGPVLPVQTVWDILLPAVATFLVVALVEEGLRYIMLRVWFYYSRAVDQVFDGLVLGVAAGLGFATLENTLYFLNLFQQGSVDTLVFVFFLRFMISTLAHITFGGLMGALLTRGLFSMYHQRRYFLRAFFLSWFGHGLFDLLLGLNLSLYAVVLLLAPLTVVVLWSSRRDFLVLEKKQGQLLVFEEAPETRQSRLLGQFLRQFESPWNKYAPWLHVRRRQSKLAQELAG